jgi:hypothetical protein
MPKKLSPVQRKMLEVLADGLPHRRAELHACLWDREGAMRNIRTHLSIIRKHLNERGESIICEMHEKHICYRHVRLLRS